MLIRSQGARAANLFFIGTVTIMLDGVEVFNVIEADDEAGYIIRVSVDEAGAPIIDYGRSARTERLEGTVVISGQRRFSPDDAKAAAAAKRARRHVRNLEVASRAVVRNAISRQGGGAI